MLEQIRTKRLLLTLANLSDLSVLEEIEKECDEYFKFDPPSAADHNRSLRECLTIGDIIPNVSEEDYKKENYYLYCIHKGDIIVGWFSLYLGYQQKDTVYLSVLYIKEAYRKNGFGAEILEAMTCKLLTKQYKLMCLHCSLRDVTALRFWVKNGFDKIVDVECNGNLYPDNFGGIELVKNLNRNV